MSNGHRSIGLRSGPVNYHKRIDREQVKKLYSEGLSVVEIAGLVDCNYASVIRILKLMGVKRHNK